MTDPTNNALPVSEAVTLKVQYLTRRRNWRGQVITTTVRAVDGVDLSVRPGEALALVGESGCGKSTLGRALLRLEQVSEGVVRFAGSDLTGLDQAALRPLRRNMQMVFQDPFSSLNPRMSIGETLAEPLLVHGLATKAQARQRVAEMLDIVGLDPQVVSRYPHAFSGGQRQRIAIARAVIGRPQFVVADEPISALDISVQAQILDLFEDLKERFSLTYLFISHDLAVVRHIADRVAVMYLGRIVEQGAPDEVFGDPQHPYTQALLAAVPAPDPVLERRRPAPVLRGEPPSPSAEVSGCRFRGRCPHSMAVCATSDPLLTPTGSKGHAVACFLHHGHAR
ncbi:MULTISPECIES: ABC transporter ATP-binding protein [unclassified Rhizobium]|uniref:ABC transporter ATP-binding protein n=1 Tax=unclassified Rhizobium TaxID=2613769 RepID=UPI0016229118|nr:MULTISPECIES: oligopeptide/dipeptide ABC transporter ATP-binding protein [unclassified Rhizobium]MBB3320385.1 oligopeptide/dipeptide ABC transporter ATP-binding protein [Rhizobium sp. BK181]MCS4096248.1 oligopeptide/dipeptide ABC transporter ATP-binding protein [Rhizobium sp. BK176]